MKESEFIQIIINPLYEDRLSINKINNAIYDEVIHMADKFLMPTQIKNNLIFDTSTPNILSTELDKIANISKLKNLINKNEVARISNLYIKNGIEHVFLKGSAINLLSDDYVRYSRDIDILVAKNSIPKAYQLLKEIGYSYMNPLVSDTTKYINSGHHLPILSHSNGALIEIHHRLTRKSSFKKCPLTETIITKSITLDKNGVRIYIPDINHLIAHLTYHSVVQHTFNLGPIFLYDIKFLRSFLKDQDSLINLLNKCDLEKDYMKIVDYIDNKKMIDIFGIYNRYKIRSHNEKNPKTFTYFFFSKKGRFDFLNIIKRKLEFNEDIYQTSKFSIKFYLILLINLKNHILRLLKH
jgi:hypothetical protein